MLRGGDNANIRISIESHKDGCYENNQLTPAFNSLTAVYNNTQCCHRNTAMYRESVMSLSSMVIERENLQKVLFGGKAQ